MASATDRLFHRDGTSQGQRRLAEIAPLYAKLDDRGLKDLLAFLWRMAEYVQYYDSNHRVNGHWQDFLGVEKAVLLALVATHDTSAMRRDTLDQHGDMQRGGDDSAYQRLFELLYAHCGELQALYDNTRDVLGEQILLSLRNKRLLESIVVNLLVLYRRYQGDTSSDYGDGYTEKVQIFAQALELDLLSTDPTPFHETPGSQAFDERLREALYGLHQDLQKLFGTIMAHAERQLHIELERRADFQPHVGLLLGFLKLFRRYQDQLNGLSERHLMFYYRDVLKIDYRPKVADRAFLIIQLAKHADVCRLEQGTLFTAGNDATGQPLVYAATEEFVANRAQVGQLKSLYRYTDPEEEPAQAIGEEEIDRKRIKGAVMADSLDGAGEEPLDPEQPQFHPFGGSELREDAALGFAFASPILRLAGGQRVITLTVELTNTTLAQDVRDIAEQSASMFALRLSCADGWQTLTLEDLPEGEFEVRGGSADSGNPQIEIVLTLGVDFPALVDVTPVLHGGQFPDDNPVCQVVLRQTEQGSLYEVFRRLSFVSCSVHVHVTQLQPEVLQNDLGVLKPEKPHMVFGHAPRDGATFYVGQAEALAKQLSTLALSWDWVDEEKDPATWYTGYEKVDGTTFQPVTVAFERLVDNAWQSIDEDRGATPVLYDLPAEEASEDASPGMDRFSFTLSETATGYKTLEALSQYSADVQDGFVRMILQDNGFLFGHKFYSAALLKAVSSSFTSDGEGNVEVTHEIAAIRPPLVPTIENVRLEYTAEASLTAGEGGDNLQFFHLHPFGASLETVDDDPDREAYPLVHDVAVEGAFYIGLTSLVPPQSVSLLFHFVEGTGDISLPMPDTVQWDYLNADGWQAFDERGVLSDGTTDLSGTGIVSLALPVEATSQSSIMPAGLFWIRVSVSANSRAVNKLAAVTTQAMTVELQDQDNDVSHYQQALPAGSIGKLVSADPQVKAIIQPFASFGARPPETQEGYRVRVSERLRHKDRAVTLWDYEHLVLDRFPQIHKVTCLNHCNADAQSQPGHVLVIVIPNLENLNAVNILQPSASIALREEIHAFLEARCSTFVTLHVANPVFEQIKVIADVTFCQGCDEGFYNTQLSQDIVDFLTPWKHNHEAIRFFERLHSSVILNFIEERPYVDYLTRFQVQKQVVGTDETEAPIQLGDLVRSRADALFVSAVEHAINEIEPA